MVVFFFCLDFLESLTFFTCAPYQKRRPKLNHVLSTIPLTSKRPKMDLLAKAMSPLGAFGPKISHNGGNLIVEHSFSAHPCVTNKMSPNNL